MSRLDIYSFTWRASSSIYTISDKKLISQLSLPQSHKLHGSSKKNQQNTIKCMEKVKHNLLSHSALLPPVTANSMSHSWGKTLRRRNLNFYHLPKCDAICRDFFNLRFNGDVTEETGHLVLMLWPSSKILKTFYETNTAIFLVIPGFRIRSSREKQNKKNTPNFVKILNKIIRTGELEALSRIWYLIFCPRKTMEIKGSETCLYTNRAGQW